MEPISDAEIYIGFMDLLHLSKVEISRVSFTWNVIPSIYFEENSDLIRTGILNLSR